MPKCSTSLVSSLNWHITVKYTVHKEIKLLMSFYVLEVVWVLQRITSWLFQVQNVHVDPYRIIKNLQETVDKMAKNSLLGNRKMVELNDD
jgi:hypothetical protein